MAYIFAILLLAAPLYVWRFSIGGLPTNFLMVFAFLVIGYAKTMMWTKAKLSIPKYLGALRDEYRQIGKPMLVGILLVSAASLISLFAFGFTLEKFAQWFVLYLLPISVFIVIRYFAQRDQEVLRKVSLAAYWILLAAGILAFIQYTTRVTLPMEWWGNANEPKRAIAFFAHANAYALFATPLLAWLIPDMVRRLQKFWFEKRQLGLDLLCVLAWVGGALGMFLTLSRGAWLGIMVAAGLYVLLSANKKMFLFFTALAAAMIIFVAAVPNLRYRVILPFYGEKSAIARLSLWDTGTKMLKDSPPASLLLGKGINGFDSNWDKFNTDPNLEHYNFPHNIFLNFWIDLGFFGMLGMIIIIVTSSWYGFKNRKNLAALGLLLFMAAMVVHGLIDIPYLKNDLALVFWMVLGLSYKNQSA